MLAAEFVSFCLILQVVSSWQDLSEYECAEIWNAEHLEDVLCDKEEKVTKNALLVLYGPACSAEAEAIWAALADAPLPHAQYLILLRHDHLSAAANTWFNYTEKYNLTQRLHVTKCLEIFFLKKGASLDAVYKYPTRDFRNLVTWTWNHLLINVSVYNAIETPLRITLEGYIPYNSIDYFELEARKVISLPTYTSNIIKLYNSYSEEFVDGFKLISNTHIEATNKSRYKGKEEVWKLKSHFEQRENEENSKLFLCSHHRRHFNILTQPRSVPNFTVTGFHLTRIPPHVHQILLQIYEEKKNELAREYYPDYFTVWNLDEINIQQVTLSEGKTLYLAEELQPIMENWCRCTLRPTKGDGIVTRIRRYPNGSRVRMHVDEIESGHVIGAILQVAQDPNMDPLKPWPLEVINFSGQRQKIVMKAGDMVLFESSRLVHGRPSTLHGQYYINSFFYFTPPKGWNVYSRGNLRGVPMAEFTDAMNIPSTTQDLPKQQKGLQRLGQPDEL